MKCCLPANIYFFTCFPALWKIVTRKSPNKDTFRVVKTSLKLLIKPSKTAWVNLGIPEITQA